MERLGHLPNDIGFSHIIIGISIYMVLSLSIVVGIEEEDAGEKVRVLFVGLVDNPIGGLGRPFRTLLQDPFFDVVPVRATWTAGDIFYPSWLGGDFTER